jgi:hypothetical protein
MRATPRATSAPAGRWQHRHGGALPEFWHRRRAHAF